MTRILLVEDDNGSIRLMGHIARKAGVELAVAETGEKGVELALSGQPDIILMDIGLPGIDGYEAMRRIRATDKNVPIIAITSSVMAGDRERALGSGFNGYIGKPYDPLRVMDTILELARQRTC